MPARNVQKPFHLSEMVDYREAVQGGREHFFREKEIEEVVRCLAAGDVNPLLVGRSGCGKEFVVRGVTKRLSESEDEYLRNLRILGCEITFFLVGTEFRGQVETRVESIMKEIETSPDPIVLFLDEIHLAIGAGATLENVQGDLASMLRGHMGMGRPLRLIGGTTPEGLNVMSRRDPVFAGRFRRIRMEELSEEATQSVLVDYVASYHPHKKSFFRDEFLYRQILHYGRRLFTNRAFPGAAVDLLRELLVDLDHLREGEDGHTRLLEVIARKTGLQRFLFDDGDRLTRGQVIRALRATYYGQDRAVETLADVILRKKADIAPPYRPSGVFLFVGPTGVGKTELARCLARYLYGDEGKLKIVDMSEFGGADTAALFQDRLVGHALEDPFAILLLDELERAASGVWSLLLQVTGDGRLTDTRGRSADFRNMFILMTSNVGSELYERKNPECVTDEEILERVAHTFRPEFLNRIEKQIVFQPLPEDVRGQIVNKEFKRALTDMRRDNPYRREGIAGRELRITWDDPVVDFIAREGYSPRYGARALQRAIEDLVIFPLSEAITSGNLVKGDRVRIRLSEKKDRIAIEKEGAEADER